MTSVDLMGRLSPGYAESITRQIHAALREGQAPEQIREVLRAATRERIDAAEQDSPEFETWIAMHQRIWIQAVLTYKC